MKRWLIPLFMLLALAACTGEDGAEAPADEEEELLATNLLALSSPAFGEGETIPIQYTCEGEDVPPPLTWQEPPTGVDAFALIMDDPDAPAGTWVHWVLYNIPPEMREVGTGAPGLTGTNSWGREAYGGPCPPPGTEHRYFFKLYALDTTLSLEPGADKETVLNAMEGHVLARGQLMGRFER